MIAKSGDRLLDDEALGAMKSELLRKAFLVTPNIPEAETLAGITISSEEDRREAARRILALGPSAVVDQGRASAVGEHRRPAVRRPAVRGVPDRASRRDEHPRHGLHVCRGRHGASCRWADTLEDAIPLGAGVHRRRHPARAGPGKRPRPDESFLGSAPAILEADGARGGDVRDPLDLQALDGGDLRRTRQATARSRRSPAWFAITTRGGGCGSSNTRRTSRWRCARCS